MFLPCSAPLFLFKPAAPEGVPTNWNERPGPPLGAEKWHNEEEAKPMGVANYDIVPVGKFVGHPARWEGQWEIFDKGIGIRIGGGGGFHGDPSGP
jgi:hypothetical protein